MLLRSAAFLLVLLPLALWPASSQAGELQWLGHSAVRVLSAEGQVILIDPYLTKNPKTPEQYKKLENLLPVDFILVSHGHSDHLGDTAALARLSGAKVISNPVLGELLAALEWVPASQAIPLTIGESHLAEGLVITMVPARHASEVWHWDPKTKKQITLPGGEAVGFVIQLPEGKTLYHAGDTWAFPEMTEIAETYRPDIAMLPIGGHSTMDPFRAAFAVRELLKSPFVLPLHYGTEPKYPGRVEDFAELLQASESRLWILAPGEVRKF